MSSTEPMPLNTEQETRQRQLLGLGRLLLQQARAGQWDAVRLTDGRLARFIDQLSKQPQLWTALAPARTQVRGWHQQALQLCEQETALRKQEWQGLSQQREGLAAYDEVEQWA